MNDVHSDCDNWTALLLLICYWRGRYRQHRQILEAIFVRTKYSWFNENKMQARLNGILNIALREWHRWYLSEWETRLTKMHIIRRHFCAQWQCSRWLRAQYANEETLEIVSETRTIQFAKMPTNKYNLHECGQRNKGLCRLHCSFDCFE